MAAGFGDFNHSRNRSFRREEERYHPRFHKCRNAHVGQSRKAIERHRNVAAARIFDARGAVGAFRGGKCVEMYVDERGIVLTMLAMIVICLALPLRRLMQMHVLIGRHNERLQQHEKQRE